MPGTGLGARDKHISLLELMYKKFFKNEEMVRLSNVRKYGGLCFRGRQGELTEIGPVLTETRASGSQSPEVRGSVSWFLFNYC